MSRALRTGLRPLLAIAGLVVLAGAVAGYILDQQRLRFPWDDTYTVRAELPTGQALTPGQGQIVTVAGVKVGEISRVRARDGRAVVDLEIERDLLPGGIRRDATLLVRPRTPLQDMTIDVDPGGPRAPRLGEDDVLGVERATPSVNLDEVLATLDEDTRAWATSLVQAGGRALKDRGAALRQVLRASAPTLKATRRLTAVTAARRRELARVVSRLRDLSGAVAREDRALGRLVSSGAATFEALASEDTALRAGLQGLPPTLAQADAALEALRPLARDAGPALDRLLPTARTLPATLRAVDRLSRDGTPALRELERLSRVAREPARDLRVAARDLADVTPDLTDTFVVLRQLTNILAFNPQGREEGFMFWLAWFNHNGNSFLSGQDANGPLWRGTTVVSCSTLANNPATVGLFGPFLEQLDLCPEAP